MAAMTIFDQYKEDMRNHVRSIASEVTRQLKPTADMLTQRQLYKEFGAAWAKERIRSGKPEFRGCRMGHSINSPIKYSRAAFALEWEANRSFAINLPEIQGKYANPDTII